MAEKKDEKSGYDPTKKARLVGFTPPPPPVPVDTTKVRLNFPAKGEQTAASKFVDGAEKAVKKIAARLEGFPVVETTSKFATGFLKDLPARLVGFGKEALSDPPERPSNSGSNSGPPPRDGSGSPDSDPPPRDPHVREPPKIPLPGQSEVRKPPPGWYDRKKTISGPERTR